MTIFVDSTNWKPQPSLKVALISPTVTVHCGDAAELVPYLAPDESAIFIARCDNDRLVIGQTAGVEPRLLMRSIQKSGSATQLVMIAGVADEAIRATLTRVLYQHLVAGGAEVAGDAPSGSSVDINGYNAARACAGPLLVQLLLGALLPHGLRYADLLAGSSAAPEPQDLYEAIDAASESLQMDRWNARAMAYGEKVILLPGTELFVSAVLRTERANQIFPMIYAGAIAHIVGPLFRLERPVAFDNLDAAAAFAVGGTSGTETWHKTHLCALTRFDATTERTACER
jgi:hypothetical protein